MKKFFKKLIAAISALAVTATMVTLPISVKAATLNSWKFDFGAEGTAAESGYTLVTPDMHVINNENRNYGFIGTNAKDYRLNGGRIDGFVQQQGQVIDLIAGKNGIGSVGIKDKSVTEFNSGDYYPVRFALKVPDETYYKVKATVTTLNPDMPATASLYTERKHPVFTQKKIGAGEMVTAEFTVRTTPVYYEKSDPKGLVADGYVNVCLLGENAALAALEIEQIDSAPTLWILGDSTVTDGGGSLPFFPLQNYTGVGTGVTKYLPCDIAMVNEGEGGLAANDNNHFNTVKSRLKAGDFLWVEYGHNHKTDGAAGYTSALGKYYDACKAVGATLILVGPIDRINSYNASTNTWSTSLKSFSDAAKTFVDAKLKANPNDKVAFVDLNAPSLEWFGKITKSGVVNNSAVTNAERLVHFYFQAPRGAKDVDHTHPNDAGAENLAYLFFENADSNAYPALKSLLTRFESGNAEKPTLVSEEIINMGYPANGAWPSYSVGVSYEYPLVITKVNINANNQIESLTCKLMDKNLLTSYAAGFVEIDNITYQTTIESHIDNSAANNGSLYTVEFAKNNLPQLKSNKDENFRAYMAGVDMADNDRPLENVKAFSADYTPLEFNAYILPGPDGDVETFDYYGYSTLTGSGEWLFGGSAGSNFTLGTDSDGRTYSNLKSIPGSGGGSYSLNRALQNLSGGTAAAGRYLFQMDIKVETATNDGFVFQLANGWKTASPFIQGDTLQLFTVSGNGTVTSNNTAVGKLTVGKWGQVKCVLDMDAAVMLVSVDGGAEQTVNLARYQGFTAPNIASMNNFVIGTTKNNANADMKISNLIGAKYNLYDHMKSTLSLSADEGSAPEGEYGSVYINTKGTTQLTVNAGEMLTATAQATEKGRFLGWYMNGALYSKEANVSLRMYTDASLVATFAPQTDATDVIINYLDTNGKPIKEQIVLTVNDSGQNLYEEMEFTLNESYKSMIKKESRANGYYDVYFFKSANCEKFAALGAKGTNVINLTFEHDGTYFEYEDFETRTDTWGFVNEASMGDGVLNVLTGVGTSRRNNSVKTVDAKITEAKKLTVRFDWRSGVDAAVGRNSSFNLLDSDGTHIFSINAKGKNGLDYGVGKFADTAISTNGSGVNDWYSIVLTANFDDGTLSGTITNKATGRVITINNAKIAAKNLKTISATYGYSSASQQLDNFGFRDDSFALMPVVAEITKKEGTKVTINAVSTENGEYSLITAVYNGDELIGVKTANAKLEAGIAAEITVDTEHNGEVAVFFWGDNMAPLSEKITK